jgi:23S rRNA pseudouridine2605 synthase
MEHPSGKVFRVYQVKARGILNHEKRENLVKGIRLKEGIAKAETIELDKISSDISRFKMTLAEGKNREVRRLCEEVGLEVLDLKRIQYGKVLLGTLPVGRFREPYFEEKSFFDKLLRKPRNPSPPRKPARSGAAKR